MRNIINFGSEDEVFNALKDEFYNSLASSGTSDLEAPIFIAPSYERLCRYGFQIPRQFVIETDGIIKDNKTIYECLETSIKQRIEFIKYPLYKNGDEQDWCMGAFRRYLFMDERSHGISGLMDLDSYKGNKQDWFNKWLGCDEVDGKQEDYRLLLRARLGLDIYKDFNTPAMINSDSLFVYKKAFEEIYSDSFKIIKNILNTPYWLFSYDSQIRCLKLYDFFSNDDLKFKGTTIKYLKPSGKLRILVIDDDDKVVDYLNKVKLRGDVTLKDVFLFSGLNDGRIPIKITNSAEDFTKNLQKFSSLETMHNLSYDAILVDLCIGENSQSDPTGYHFIPILKKFFPTTPIVAYSKFEDMGHISRAFSLGARWYLRKGHEHKLPRHIISIIGNPEWKHEWANMHDRFEGNLSLGKYFPERKDQYLLARAVDDLPGKINYFKSLTAGSTAKTIKLTKTVPKDTSFVVKIDSTDNTWSEYERYQRFVRPYIDNNAGRIYKRPIIVDRANSSIAYTFAGDVQEQTKLYSLKERVESEFYNECNAEKVLPILDFVFDNIFPKLHSIVRNDKDDPDYPNVAYGESNSIIDGYMYRMPAEKMLKVDEFYTSSYDIVAQGEGIVKGEKKYVSVAITSHKEKSFRGFYYNDNQLTSIELTGDLVSYVNKYCLVKPKVVFVDTSIKENKGRWKQLGVEGLLTYFIEEALKFKDIPSGIIHGDTNLGNIMADCDSNGNLCGEVWLIDFARTRRDIITHDYDVLFVTILRTLFIDDDDSWLNFVFKHFKSLFLNAVFGEPLNWELQALKNPRLTLISKMLIRVRKEANRNLPKNTFPVFLALSMLYVTRLVKPKNWKERDSIINGVEMIQNKLKG